jgi:tRNA A37 threonylcarbamoyladenosine dehydratase
MKSRALEINPECSVNAIEEFFTSANAEELLGGGFDAVFDAIDSVANKCLLLSRCKNLEIPIVTSGAAAGRSDPTAVRISDLTTCTHDRLLQRVRKVLRTEYGFPDAGKKFGIDAVYSPEAPAYPRSDGTVCPTKESGETRINCDTGMGTASFVTGAFAFVAASRIVKILLENRCK